MLLTARENVIEQPLSRQVLSSEFTKMNLSLYQPKKTNAIHAVHTKQETFHNMNGTSIANERIRHARQDNLTRKLVLKKAVKPLFIPWIYKRLFSALGWRHKHCSIKLNLVCTTLHCSTCQTTVYCAMFGMKVKVA